MSRTSILLRGLLQGVSLTRTLQNIEFTTITIGGQGIDLGAKSKAASYYQFINIEENTNIRFADLISREKDILVVDLEKKIPVDDESQDFLLLNNTLEHLFDYERCI